MMLGGSDLGWIREISAWWHVGIGVGAVQRGDTGSVIDLELDLMVGWGRMGVDRWYRCSNGWGWG